MGYRRAGWYSYDFFDNDGVHVNRILPEFQELRVGDVMRTDAEGGIRVEAIDPGRSAILIPRRRHHQLLAPGGRCGESALI